MTLREMSPGLVLRGRQPSAARSLVVMSATQVMGMSEMTAAACFLPVILLLV